nr:hypothetical protein [Salinarchaeum laminariae]
MDEYTTIDALVGNGTINARLPVIWNAAVGMVYPVCRVKLSSF